MIGNEKKIESLVTTAEGMDCFRTRGVDFFRRKERKGDASLGSRLTNSVSWEEASGRKIKHVDVSFPEPLLPSEFPPAQIWDGRIAA